MVPGPLFNIAETLLLAYRQRLTAHLEAGPELLERAEVAVQGCSRRGRPRSTAGSAATACWPRSCASSARWRKPCRSWTSSASRRAPSRPPRSAPQWPWSRPIACACRGRRRAPRPGSGGRAGARQGGQSPDVGGPPAPEPAVRPRDMGAGRPRTGPQQPPGPGGRGLPRNTLVTTRPGALMAH
jgi:hypothetical protein